MQASEVVNLNCRNLRTGEIKTYINIYLPMYKARLDLQYFNLIKHQSTCFGINPNLQLLQQQLYKQEQMWQLSDLNKNLSTYKHKYSISTSYDIRRTN